MISAYMAFCAKCQCIRPPDWTHCSCGERLSRDTFECVPTSLKVMSCQLLRLDHVDVRLDRMEQSAGPDLWAIRKGGGVCLNKEGDWELEAMPSNRNKEFFESCRFASADEAVAFWESGPKQALIDYHNKVKERSQWR